MKQKILLIVLNADWFFLSHRLEHAVKAEEKGYKVIIAAGDTGVGEKILDFGFEYYPFKIERSGKNLFKEYNSFLQILRIYRKIKPDIIHHFTWKPILYGTFAARLLGIKQIVNTVTGFGYLFISRTGNTQLLSRFIVVLLKFLLSSKRVKIIVQNQHDYDTFLRWNIVPASRLRKINGAGVDLNVFKLSEEVEINGRLRISLPARMIADKGIWEFVGAVKTLEEKYKDKVEFFLAGAIDSENITSLNENDLGNIERDTSIQWLGFVEDMPDFLASCNIIILPSYREGLPKVLLETLSVGRAVITTDVPGCRDVVSDGEEGILVPLYDVNKLAKSIQTLVEDQEKREKMGIAGRKKAEVYYDVNKVVKEILEFYDV